MHINQITLANSNVKAKRELKNNSQGRFMNGLDNGADSFAPSASNLNTHRRDKTSFGIEPVTTTVAVLAFLWDCITTFAVVVGIEAALAAVIGGGIYGVMKISEWVDNNRKAKAEALKIQTLKDENAKVEDNNHQITSKGAHTEYVKEAERVTIQATGTGQESGLNKVIGSDLLKLGLVRNVLVPLAQAMDGDASAKNRLPNGINFFGPKGTGKTFVAESLGEHYQKLGGYFEKLNFDGNTEKDIKNMTKVFNEAEQRFRTSGNKKYTIVFLDEIDKKVRKEGFDGYNADRNARLLELASNCKDRGVIFMSASNDLAKVSPDLLRNGRTDLRVPLGAVDICDVADMINFYVKASKKPYDNLDYEAITNDLKTKNLAYKPLEIEATVQNATRRITSGYLDTNKLRAAIAKSDIEFNEIEQQQFEAEKGMVKKLGGINPNARYSDEDVVK